MQEIGSLNFEFLDIQLQYFKNTTLNISLATSLVPNRFCSKVSDTPLNLQMILDLQSILTCESAEVTMTLLESLGQYCIKFKSVLEHKKYKIHPSSSGEIK